MKMKEQTIKELEELKPNELMKVYDLILALKGKPPKGRGQTTASSYLKVRKALKMCKGSMSDDILSGREDRV